jgi:cardiolipin synthase (CMP-forming)
MQGWLTIPNLFTLLRLVLAPAIIYELAAGRARAALLLFAAAAATDGLDGYLARRLGSSSRVGAMLDPIADKLLLSGLFLTLAYLRKVPIWFVVLVFGRDLAILACAGYALLFMDIRSFPPSVWGKLSTFLQVLVATALLTRAAVNVATLDGLLAALVWCSAAATLWSGAHYAWRAYRPARAH